MKKHLITMGILAIAYGVGCGGGEDNTPPCRKAVSPGDRQLVVLHGRV